MPPEANGKTNGTTLNPPHMRALFKLGDLSQEQVFPDWQKTITHDYVNALPLSETGEAMIFERGKNGSGAYSWQVVGGYVEEGEDPMTAIQRVLLEKSGHSSEDWVYLGSYMITDTEHQMGIGHFFCAQNTQQATQSPDFTHEDMEIKWVSQRDLKYALLDGRISVLSYAITISMVLLTVLD